MNYIHVYLSILNSIEISFSKIKSNYRKLNHNDIEKDIMAQEKVK